VGTLVHNIAKGRVAELHNRVKVGDPAAARLYAIPVSRAAVTDAQLAYADDFAAIVTLGITERTTNGWTRITLAAADLTAIAPDDTNDRMAADSIDLTWTSVALAGGAITDIIICYASVGSPTNAQLLSLTTHDFPITPDGSNVVATVTDYYRAT
jgi:hypothetical protein